MQGMWHLCAKQWLAGSHCKFHLGICIVLSYALFKWMLVIILMLQEDWVHRFWTTMRRQQHHDVGQRLVWSGRLPETVHIASPGYVARWSPFGHALLTLFEEQVAVLFVKLLWLCQYGQNALMPQYTATDHASRDATWKCGRLGALSIGSPS